MGVVISQAGILSVTAAILPPTVPTTFTEDTGTATPALNNINILGGAGIATSGAGSTITITAIASGFTWSTVAGTTQAVVKENGYVTSNVALTTFTLPATSAVGDTFKIAGVGSGGWSIAQNAGQVIHFNSTDTTVGVGGSISSTNRYNNIEITAVVANTDWTVFDSSGTLTVV